MPLSRINNPFLSSSGAGNASITSPAANTVAFTTATTERMRIDSSGNVGIGTSSPTAQIHVKNGGGNSISILGQYGTGTIAQMGAYANQVDIKAYNGTSDVMTFTTGASERMRIDSSGNVGINTTGTFGTLAVAGNICPVATPSTNWGIDFATTTAAPNYITLATSATYDLAGGSGIVVIHNNGSGEAAIFLTWAGNVTKLGGASTVVSGTGTTGQIGMVYNSGVGKYRINNAYATTQSIFVTTIRTRTTT